MGDEKTDEGGVKGGGVKASSLMTRVGLLAMTSKASTMMVVLRVGRG